MNATQSAMPTSHSDQVAAQPHLVAALATALSALKRSESHLVTAGLLCHSASALSNASAMVASLPEPWRADVQKMLDLRTQCMRIARAEHQVASDEAQAKLLDLLRSCVPNARLGAGGGVQVSGYKERGRSQHEALLHIRECRAIHIGVDGQFTLSVRATPDCDEIQWNGQHLVAREPISL